MDDSSTSGTEDDTDLEFDDLDAERLCLDPVIFYKHCAVEVIVQDDAGYCQVSAGRLVRAKGAWRISRAHTAGRWQPSLQHGPLSSAGLCNVAPIAC